MGFGEEWATSAVPRLNPFAFMATSLAIAGGVELMLSRLVRDISSGGESLWAILRDALTPYTYYLAVGVCVQSLLWLFRGRRRFRDAAAMAVYAGAISALLLNLPGDVVHAIRGSSSFKIAPAMMPLVLALTGVFYVPLAMSICGLYVGSRVGSGRVIAAVAITWVGSAVFFGMVEPPGKYGIRPTRSVHRDHSRDENGDELDDVSYGFGAKSD